ncbi:hypothetical protein P8631_11720 [Guyparkeria sp. 1SP6A2]|nr:hypothetical protein [Guyparkeria sp. 1SP6A2]
MSDLLDTLIVGLAMTAVFFLLVRRLERFILARKAAEQAEDKRHETYASLFDQIEPTCPRCGQPVSNPSDADEAHDASVVHGRETGQQRPRCCVD